jgi:hypothetical protein
MFGVLALSAISRESRRGSPDERYGIFRSVDSESLRLSLCELELGGMHEIVIRSGELALRGMTPTNKAGPPNRFWIPTKMERDIAFRLSLKKAPSVAVPPPAHASPQSSLEDGPSSGYSISDFRSKIFMACHSLQVKIESLTSE